MELNILIVEDHELTRFGLKTAFEACDYVENIYEAESAETCLDILSDKKVDLVIMDLGLPGINGIEATKKVKDGWDDDNNRPLEKEVDDTMSISLKSAKDLYLLAERGTVETQDDGTETLVKPGGKIEIGDGTNELIVNIPPELQRGIYARFA